MLRQNSQRELYAAKMMRPVIQQITGSTPEEDIRHYLDFYGQDQHLSASEQAQQAVSLTLQQVSRKKDYFISINDRGAVNPAKVLWETEYEHPVYSVAAFHAQKKLSALNQNGKIYFCGSYFKYGFHEDALTSALEAAREITGQPIWQ